MSDAIEQTLRTIQVDLAALDHKVSDLAAENVRVETRHRRSDGRHARP
jgi:hypothetical protein